MHTITIPAKPPRALLVSMALRLDHSFWMNKMEVLPGVMQGYTKEERERRLVQMEQLYDEVAGRGFFNWDGQGNEYYERIMDKE